MSDPVVLLSTGDVVGPAGGVTNNSMVLFNGTSGKIIKGNNAVVTTAGLALLDDVDAAAQRVTLGLGSVNNTSDLNKPVSTAQQTALNLKANNANAALTGVPTAPTAPTGTNTTQLATTAFVEASRWVINQVSANFTAQKNHAYFLSTSMLVTLPEVSGLSTGDAVRFIKDLSATPTIQVHGAAGELIQTTKGSDTAVIFDINAEVILVWADTKWEV